MVQMLAILSEQIKTLPRISLSGARTLCSMALQCTWKSSTSVAASVLLLLVHTASPCSACRSSAALALLSHGRTNASIEQESLNTVAHMVKSPIMKYNCVSVFAGRCLSSYYHTLLSIMDMVCRMRVWVRQSQRWGVQLLPLTRPLAYAPLTWSASTQVSSSYGPCASLFLNNDVRTVLLGCKGKMLIQQTKSL